MLEVGSIPQVIYLASLVLPHNLRSFGLLSKSVYMDIFIVFFFNHILQRIAWIFIVIVISISLLCCHLTWCICLSRRYFWFSLLLRFFFFSSRCFWPYLLYTIVACPVFSASLTIFLWYVNLMLSIFQSYCVIMWNMQAYISFFVYLTSLSVASKVQPIDSLKGLFVLIIYPYFIWSVLFKVHPKTSIADQDELSSLLQIPLVVRTFTV